MVRHPFSMTCSQIQEDLAVKIAVNVRLDLSVLAGTVKVEILFRQIQQLEQYPKAVEMANQVMTALRVQLIMDALKLGVAMNQMTVVEM